MHLVSSITVLQYVFYRVWHFGSYIEHYPLWCTTVQNFQN